MMLDTLEIEEIAPHKNTVVLWLNVAFIHLIACYFINLSSNSSHSFIYDYLLFHLFIWQMPLLDIVSKRSLDK